MSAPLVSKEDAITAMRVLSALAASAAVTASELALNAAFQDPEQEPRDQFHFRVAGAMTGSQEAAERAATYGRAITLLTRELFPR